MTDCTGVRDWPPFSTPSEALRLTTKVPVTDYNDSADADAPSTKPAVSSPRSVVPSWLPLQLQAAAAAYSASQDDVKRRKLSLDDSPYYHGNAPPPQQPPITARQPRAASPFAAWRQDSPAAQTPRSRHGTAPMQECAGASSKHAEFAPVDLTGFPYAAAYFQEGGRATGGSVQRVLDLAGPFSVQARREVAAPPRAAERDLRAAKLVPAPTSPVLSRARRNVLCLDDFGAEHMGVESVHDMHLSHARRSAHRTSPRHRGASAPHVERAYNLTALVSPRHDTAVSALLGALRTQQQGAEEQLLQQSQRSRSISTQQPGFFHAAEHASATHSLSARHAPTRTLHSARSSSTPRHGASPECWTSTGQSAPALPQRSVVPHLELPVRTAAVGVLTATLPLVPLTRGAISSRTWPVSAQHAWTARQLPQVPVRSIEQRRCRSADGRCLPRVARALEPLLLPPKKRPRERFPPGALCLKSVFFVVFIIVQTLANCIADIHTYWEIVHRMCACITHGDTNRWYGSPADDMVHVLHGFLVNNVSQRRQHRR